MNGLKKSAKNRGSQWHAQSAHLAHTGHVKAKCGFSGRLKKSAKGSQWHAQSTWPTQVTLRQNVSSLDAPRTGARG